MDAATAAIAHRFVGKFKLESQDNFDAYLRALGNTINSLYALLL